MPMLDTEFLFQMRVTLAPPMDVGPDRYCFRTNPLFETGDERYAWLNHVVAVGKGRTGDNGVIYDVFAVR